MAAETKVGSYTGTGAAVTVDMGFVPDYVRCWNATDGDEVYEWFSGMTAGHALKATNSASTQFSRITSNGITADNGAIDSPKGITFGSAISESGKTFRYLAVRNAEY